MKHNGCLTQRSLFHCTQVALVQESQLRVASRILNILGRFYHGLSPWPNSSPRHHYQKRCAGLRINKVPRRITSYNQYEFRGYRANVMAEFEKLIEKAIADNEIPGCVLHAINRDGNATIHSPTVLQTNSPDANREKAPLNMPKPSANAP